MPEVAMSWTYSCPHCGGVLNPGEVVVLIAAHGATRVLMGFHPAPGNYQAHVPPGVVIERGEVWDFSCPLCHTSLVSYVDRRLCALDLRADEGRQRVYFDRTAGRRATFVVSAEGEVTPHGADADQHSLELLEFV
jgi:hypothetical protein